MDSWHLQSPRIFFFVCIVSPFHCNHQEKNVSFRMQFFPPEKVSFWQFTSARRAAFHGKPVGFSAVLGRKHGTNRGPGILEAQLHATFWFSRCAVLARNFQLRLEGSGPKRPGFAFRGSENVRGNGQFRKPSTTTALPNHRASIIIELRGHGILDRKWRLSFKRIEAL